MARGSDRRDEMCRELGLGGIAHAHRIIVAGAKKGVTELLKKGLRANSLTKLGYTASGMKALGYSNVILEQIGYELSGSKKAKEHEAIRVRKTPVDLNSDDITIKEKIEGLVASGYTADQLKAERLGVHDCKRIGYDARELEVIGFRFEELVREYGVHQLRNAGFRIHELRRFFDGRQLKEAGFSASDMRAAGYGIKELLRFGYNENHVRTAGFSNKDLMREGLARTTVDTKKLRMG